MEDNVTNKITISLIPVDHLSSILPLVKILNPGIENVVLERRLHEMVKQGYQCAGAYLENRLVSVCGLWVTTRFYCGKQIEPDNVIVDPQFRSIGIGKKLMEWVYEYARGLGCETCELNARVENSPSHKFYFNEGFLIFGYHFQKQLDAVHM